MKVYVVGTSKHYISAIQGGETSNLVNADIVLFTGGEDVDPGLYDEDIHKYTCFNRTRDDFEIELFNACKRAGKMMVGICRGAQFLTVMSGGKLVQHVNNHNRSHLITIQNENYTATSTHHQMMRPFEVNHELIGVSTKKLASAYETGSGSINMHCEPELVYYPDTHCLCSQPHIENQLNSALWYKFNEILRLKYEQRKETHKRLKAETIR